MEAFSLEMLRNNFTVDAKGMDICGSEYDAYNFGN